MSALLAPRHGDLRYARLVRGREYFHAIHCTIGDKQVLVRGVVGGAAMARLAWRVLEGGYSVRTRVGGARQQRDGGGLYRE